MDDWMCGCDQCNNKAEPPQAFEHEGPCCTACDSNYMEKELGLPICCHLALVEEFGHEL